MTIQSEHHHEAPSSTPPQPQCEQCGTSEHLTIDTIDAHPDPAAGLIQVGYNCRNCGSFRAHAATVADAADALTASTNRPGLLQFGKHYLHCGLPMHTGAGKHALFSAAATGQELDPDLEIYLNTRVLHCDECGFQMEIPD